jgi:hypothetical protein
LEDLNSWHAAFPVAEVVGCGVLEDSKAIGRNYCVPMPPECLCLFCAAQVKLAPAFPGDGFCCRRAGPLWSGIACRITL